MEAPIRVFLVGLRPRTILPVQRDRYSRRRYLDEEEGINWKTV
jgi:hypothetical protein